LLERDFQAKLIKKIKKLFPGCLILKNDSDYLQGIPDIIVLHGSCWAMLEVKISEDAPFQPNQKYYIELANNMSFAAVIYPSNEEEVLLALQHALSPPRRNTRVPRCQ
jgi:hypothetical protein